MSEKQLRELIAFASGQCDKLFAREGIIYPMWHAITSTGETLIETPPFDNKDLAVAMIRALFDLRDVVRYVFVDEAWTLSRMLQPNEEEKAYREGLANHPDRIEIVMISGEDHECGQLMVHRNIIRPAKGKPYLCPLQSLDDLPFIPPGAHATQSEGRMVGLLPVRGTRQ
jgi:hypothetical protein